MAVSTRVELLGASEIDYLGLHALMASEGFSREIVGLDGVARKLPPAEYVSQGAMQREEALQRAQRAATATGRGFAVFVTEAAGWSWIGLN